MPHLGTGTKIGYFALFLSPSKKWGRKENVKMKEKFSIKNIHIATIILGIVFICIGIFHSNLWFDEAYSVGIANKSFIDIWKIGSHDVHPVLYYWILHIISLLTDESVMAYRIFSAFCISILGILGFTHIRKDFGEKTGLLFSFFSYFMPVMCAYAEEIRMYSLAVVLVTVLAIYAYRLSKNDNNKNWIIFGITSLSCLYVHYYGLMAAGIINVILLIYLIIKKRKNSILKILGIGILQLVAYIPWIMALLTQMKQVSSGFWIAFEFPKSLIEVSSSQFIGNISANAGIYVGLCVALIIYAYLVFRIIKTIKDKQDWKPGIWAFVVYMSVIIAAVIITQVLHTAILYYRYLFVITGLYIFFISYFLGKDKNKYIVFAICALTLVLGVWSNALQVKEAYGKNNMTQFSYLNENVKPGDVFTFGENSFGAGSVVSLQFTNNKQYYYNPSNWGVEEAYKAFGDQLKIYTNEDFLNEINGRVWIVDTEDSSYYNKLFNNENYKLISQKLIKTEYEEYVYNLYLVEKVGAQDQNNSNNIINSVKTEYIIPDSKLNSTEHDSSPYL